MASNRLRGQHRTHMATALLAVSLALVVQFPIWGQSNRTVRTVFFYSPECSHCHELMDGFVPQILSEYNDSLEWFYVPDEAISVADEVPAIVEIRGETLRMLFVNTQTSVGEQLYLTMVGQLEIPGERFGVPALLVGDRLMVGSVEIPSLFPGIVENALENDESEWPKLQGLQAVVDELIPLPEYNPENEAAPGTDSLSTSEAPSTVREKIMRDPFGNMVSIVVLACMVLSVIGVWVYIAMGASFARERPPSIVIPVLAAAGLLVAVYLTVVETTGTEAVCGPVGDCNSVQQSPYSKLFGVIPVGVLGLIGYVAIAASWLLSRSSFGQRPKIAAVATFGLAFAGTLFSVYLTVLEPFVIGATCLWCLSSAVLMTVVMWLAAKPAASAFAEMRGG